jgi:hypothetical protein
MAGQGVSNQKTLLPRLNVDANFAIIGWYRCCIEALGEAGAGQPGRRSVPVVSQYYQAEQAQPDRDAEQLNRELNAVRDAEGRWQKGVSGNPAGRPRGARNRATLMAEALLDTAAGILISKGIEKAISGDAVTLRFCLARILAPRRTSPVELELPALDTQQDLALAMAAVGQATAAGEITPAEASELARVVDTAMRAIKEREYEFRENRVKGRTRSPAAPPLPPSDPA